MLAASAPWSAMRASGFPAGSWIAVIRDGSTPALAGPAEPAEPLPGGRHLGLGSPAAEPRPAQLERLGPEEHMLVHEHRAKLSGIDLAGRGGDFGHGGPTSDAGNGCHGAS